ncbi:MAG: DUF4838 domain-containing protein, partial [bacterium]|nr:DUF4838 domain-containing protein [bacterium]
NRLNYWCVAEDNHPFLRKLGLKLVWGGHVIGYNYLKPGDPYPYKHAKVEGNDDLPGDVYPLSPDYLGDENGDGKLSYREAHPEWYGMNADGERVKTLRNGDYNYCTANPHATKELMKNAVQQLIDGEARDAEIVNCWTVDAGKWCTCDACKALGSQTDRNLLFVYAFDKAVKEAQAAGFINRTITSLFLAYSDVLEPPTRALPADFDYDTCIATYFPIVRNYGRKFDDPACPKNSSYAKHLVGWAADPDRHYRGQICIGEYYNVSGYKCLPICFMSTMANDIPYYYDKANARYFHYMHVTTERWGNKALTNYQMARQIWDRDTDCEALWQDYFAMRYGDAAKYMRPFYTMLEAMLSNCSELKYALAPRLSKGAGNLFPSAYMRYEPGDDCINMSWKQMTMAGKNARALIDRARTLDLPPRIAARLAEDEEAFVYGERTIQFYDALIRAYQGVRGGDEASARKAFAEAMRLSDLLRKDTASVSVSSSHANDKNALTASRAQGAIGKLTELLGPPFPEETPLVKLGGDPVGFTGRQFVGGGAVLHGYGLNVFPGRIHVSDDGNYMYAAPTSPHDRITMYFRLEEAPAGEVAMKWIGLRCPEPLGAAVPGRVAVNGAEIFAGDVPFAEDGLTEASVTIPAGTLKVGMNRLEIRNTAAKGPTSGRPWFGIDRIEMTTP